MVAVPVDAVAGAAVFKVVEALSDLLWYSLNHLLLFNNLQGRVADDAAAERRRMVLEMKALYKVLQLRFGLYGF